MPASSHSEFATMCSISRSQRSSPRSTPSSQDLVESWLKVSASETPLCNNSQDSSSLESQTPAMCEVAAGVGGDEGEGQDGREGAEGAGGAEREETSMRNGGDGAPAPQPQQGKFVEGGGRSEGQMVSGCDSCTPNSRGDLRGPMMTRVTDSPLSTGLKRISSPSHLIGKRC